MTVQILIAEDEPSIIEALTFILTRENFDIFVEMNGDTALVKLRANKPDLMILDVMLPGLNGFEVLAQTRKLYSKSELPVIMLTAKGQSQDRQHAMDTGANLFITKPFDNQDIVNAVKELTTNG